MRRRSAAALAIAASAFAPAPAHAQVCLDCFTETLGANPFSAPLVLPNELLCTGVLGLANPTGSAAYLPNVQLAYGLRDGLELQGTLGYEPSLGVRTLAGSAGGVAVLGAARLGYAYFRTEWLGEVSVPVLWSPGDRWSVRFEPQFTWNQVTGNHLALSLALARLVGPATSIALIAAPDYRLAEQLWTGSVSLAVSHALSPRWAAYMLGSVYVIDRPTPLIAIGMTYLPKPN